MRLISGRSSICNFLIPPLCPRLPNLPGICTMAYVDHLLNFGFGFDYTAMQCLYGVCAK